MSTYIHKYNKLKELKRAAIDLLDEITALHACDDIVGEARFRREWFQIVARMEEVVNYLCAENILMATSDDLASQSGYYSTISVLLRRYNHVKYLVFSEYLDWHIINPTWTQLEELLRLQQDINTKVVLLLQYVTS